MTIDAKTKPIFMDNMSTTRVDPRVLQEMLPYFSEEYGHAASRNHPYGWKAEEAVNTARERVATLINADPKEIVFTSGGTEACNLAVKGVCEMYREKGNHILIGATEHRAVIDPARRMERSGFQVTYVPVDGQVSSSWRSWVWSPGSRAWHVLSVWPFPSRRFLPWRMSRHHRGNS